jgi:hypothetical protein
LPPKLGDHWHTAYGIYVCDKFMPSLVKESDMRIPAASGIHSHGDGLIHVEPRSSAVTGQNATLGAFFDALDVEMTDDTLTVPSATEPALVAALPESKNTLTNGARCGDKDGRWVASYWSSPTGEDPTSQFTSDYEDVRIRDDRSVLTLAFVPDGTEVPKPESVSALGQGAVPEPTPTTVPGASTLPAGPAVPAGTTVPGATTVSADSTTAVPGSTSAAPGGRRLLADGSTRPDDLENRAHPHRSGGPSPFSKGMTSADALR